MATFNFVNNGSTFSLFIGSASYGPWDKVNRAENPHSLQPSDRTLVFSLVNPYVSNTIYNSDTIQIDGVEIIGPFPSKISQVKSDVIFNPEASGSGSGLPYLIYTALLTQSGTGAPVPTVLQNTIGNIVWGYSGVGYYTATLNGAFPLDKTATFLGGNDNNGNNIMSTGIYNPNVVSVFTTSAIENAGVDGALGYTTIEIRVYP